jgi:DNA-binding transcriptional regulator PaaX
MRTCGDPQHIMVRLRNLPGDLLPIHFDSRRIRDAFAVLDNQLADAPETLFVAICSDDSSIVYYKISKGIMKPQV